MLCFIKLAVLFLVTQSLSCDGVNVYTKTVEGKTEENNAKTLAFVEENKPLTLFCDVTTTSEYKDKTQILWFYQSDETKDTKRSPGVYIAGRKQDGPCGTNSKFPKTHSWCLEPKTSNLILKSPKRSDNGIFTCHATNLDDQISISQGGYKLRVLYKPSKPNYTKPSNLVEGNEYELRCKSDGYNMPSYKWFFNGTSVQSLNSKEKSELNIVEDNVAGTLNILEVHSNNFGDYYCQAENSLGLAKGDVFSLGSPFLTSWVIAAIVVTIVILILLVICLLYFFIYRKKKVLYLEGENIIHYDVPSDFVKFKDSASSKVSQSSFTPSFKQLSASGSLLISKDNNSKDRNMNDKNLLPKDLATLSNASTTHTVNSRNSSTIIKS